MPLSPEQCSPLSQEQCSPFPGFPVPASSVDDRIYSWVREPLSGCPTEAMPNQGEGRSFGADLGWLPSSAGSPANRRLAWTRVRADSVINARGFLAASELRVQFEAWEELVGTLNANSSVGLGSAMQVSSQGTSTADNKWLHVRSRVSNLSHCLCPNGVPPHTPCLPSVRESHRP